MISRYSLPEMEAIWSDESRYDRWLEVEILVCEARAKYGWMPADAAERIRRNASFTVQDISEKERSVKHDVAAFVSVVGKSLGADACYFHEGMTSSDVLDTALATQIRDAHALIQAELTHLREAVGALAMQHAYTPIVGRTHGIHAEPTTFGLKTAVWYEDLRRASERLKYAGSDVAVGKISGAVGNFAHLPPDVEAYVCERLGLRSEPAATQVVQRDRHAFFIVALGLAAGICEKIATEIRHLQRSEVLEVEEPFSAGQKGSSAMPHKKNPILCENITGLARLIRSYSLAEMENIALWHERDISHSSVERVVLPDATILLHFILRRLTRILSGLNVHTARMKSNLGMLHGLIYSQRVLLALTKAGLSRDKAYQIVQRNALKTWNDNSEFKDNISSDPEINVRFTPGEIAAWFEMTPYFRYVETIFRRVGLPAPEALHKDPEP